MTHWNETYILYLADDPSKKLLISVQDEVFYEHKKYFMKNIDFDSNEAIYLKLGCSNTCRYIQYKCFNIQLKILHADLLTQLSNNVLEVCRLKLFHC